MKSFKRTILTIGAVTAWVVSANVVEAATVLLGSDTNGLNWVDTNTLSVTKTLNVTGTTGDAVLTDVAYDKSGNLFGLTTTELYTINTSTGVASLVGSNLGASGFNALAFDANGTAYSARFNTSNLYSINTGTGVASDLGIIDDGGSNFAGSSGDIDFDSSGTMYVVDSNGGTDTLWSVTVAAGGDTEIGSTTLSLLYGLAFGSDGIMYGASGSDNNLYTVDLLTGGASSLGAINNFVGTVAFGATAAVVPLPAALPLFGGALGILGLLGWRRKRVCA